MDIQAVVFDLGGVVFGSPLHAIRRYEKSVGLSHNAINLHVAGAGPGGAWQRMERGELTMGPVFFREFDAELSNAGLQISTAEMMKEIEAESGPRDVMVEALRRLRGGGITTAALTNNWVSEEEQPVDPERAAIRALFDHYIESAVVGLRKPDPRIYQLATKTLGVAPEQTAFLDDIGSNLKGARAHGWHTIKVDEPGPALEALSQAVGIALLD